MLFGIPIWRIILIIVLIYIVVQRANLVAIPAKIIYHQRKYPESLKIFKIADKIGNLNLVNKILLGYVCLRCGEVENARKHLQLAVTLTQRGSADRNKIKNILALTSWKEGHLDEAIEDLEEVIESGFRSTVIYENLGIFYNLSGDKEKALKFNLEAYDYNSDDLIICDNLANTYFLMGEYDKAKELYDDILNREPAPHFPEAYYGYGEVLIALGQKDEGLEMIKKSFDYPFSFLSIKSKEEIEEMYKSYGGTIE